jgi:uncharacterized membrane protein
VDFYDWMLALHLLAAFAAAAALVLFSVMIVAARRMTTLEQTPAFFRVQRAGEPMVGVGMGIALIAGIILAVDADEFELWDGWILAAIVLWVVVAAVGLRSGAYYASVKRFAESDEPKTEADVLARLRAPTGAVLHVIATVAFLLLLVDMIFKPGA